MIYVDFDHHKKFSYAAIMDEKGHILTQQKIANNRATLSEFMENLRDQKVSLALEAGRDWYWIYDF